MIGVGCGHMFCRDCWWRYLHQKIVNENQGDQIQCPAHQCDIIVDDHMVYSLIGDRLDVKQRFQITVANSFVNCNPLLTWCPGAECNHIVRVARREAIRIDCSSCSSLVPIVNNCLSAEGVIKTNNTVDISVAVASPTGLITPIVFNADKLGIVEIGAAVQDLAEKARNNKLQPHEFMGRTFTISNLGMFGIKEITAIINSPLAAILAVGAGIPELSFDPAHPTQPKSVSSMRFTLCADARVIDDVSASLFISHLKTLLENPHYLLTEDAANSGDNLSRAWGY